MKEGLTLIETVIAAVIIFMTVGVAATALSTATTRIANARSTKELITLLDESFKRFLMNEGDRETKEKEVTISSIDTNATYRVKIETFRPSGCGGCPEVTIKETLERGER